VLRLDHRRCCLQWSRCLLPIPFEPYPPLLSDVSVFFSGTTCPPAPQTDVTFFLLRPFFGRCLGCFWSPDLCSAVLIDLAWSSRFDCTPFFISLTPPFDDQFVWKFLVPPHLPGHLPFPDLLTRNHLLCSEVSHCRRCFLVVPVPFPISLRPSLFTGHR